MKILFVCFGNTCRSPMAEAVFKDLVKKQNLESTLEIDSAGISAWQAGQSVNENVQEILNKNNIPFGHTARQIAVADFSHFDLILGMDEYNIQELHRFADTLESEAEVKLLGDYNPDESDRIIFDPFFDDKKEDFDKCFSQINLCCSELLKDLISKNKIRVKAYNTVTNRCALTLGLWGWMIDKDNSVA